MPTESQIPEIRQSDLKDPTVSRLNIVLRLLCEKIIQAQGGSGPFTFLAAMTAPGLSSSSTLSVSGQPTLSGLREYADNAAALAGGLFPGDVYKTATGELRIVVE